MEKELEEIIGKDNIKYNEPMKYHTTMHVGGNADIFIEVNNYDNLIKILNIKDIKNKKVKLTMIGNGSNTIVTDKGIEGLVIKYISHNFSIKKVKDYYMVKVDAGMQNGMLANELMEREIQGFEFAAGIPGTIGGAVVMNAGAFKKEMKEIVNDVTYYDLKENKVETIDNEQVKFDYRHSNFLNNSDIIILSATLKLEKGNRKEISDKIINYMDIRIEKQPLDFSNSGSTFKRGNNFITAKLIDDCGLKGYKIGDAEVSTKHAGFIINRGNATAKDVIDLIEYVKKEVYRKFNLKIETEVRIIGR